MNLDAVTEALLADARADADRVRGAAERDAQAAVAAARDEADRLLAAARVEGEAEARAVASVELARARRQARGLVLAARRDAYDRALAAAQRAASDLRDAAGYDALVEALIGLAHDRLGPGAAVAVDSEVGGVTATDGAHSVDYRLPAVAARCFAALGPKVEELWR